MIEYTDVLKLILLPVAGSIVTLIIGYFVFRNDQKNKNLAVGTQFTNMGKDITMNDERINDKVDRQEQHNEKMFNKLGNEMSVLQSAQVHYSNDLTATKTTLKHLGDGVKDISEKLDTVITALVTK